MADTLSRKLTAGKDDGIILGIKSTSGVDYINHALFADDTLLLGGALLRMTRVFKEIVQIFCLVSWALISTRNNTVYGWNTDHSTMVNISQILDFVGYDTWDKVKYPGLPLTLGHNNPSLWLEIIRKIKAKIASWVGQWLTKVVKLIMIKSILSILPIYQSSLLLAPKAIVDQISKLIRYFLW